MISKKIRKQDKMKKKSIKFSFQIWNADKKKTFDMTWVETILY